MELTGNLSTLYESLLRFIRRYTDLWDARATRTEKPGMDPPIAARANYHRGAVAESIANALIHRDLGLRDLTTRVHVFDRAIEIINPRRSQGFTPQAQKAIRFGIPQRLNPGVAAIFSSPAYGLQLPTGGLPMVLREARLFANRLPDVAAFNDEFRLRLHGV
jgi:predicted HTH transcriptional regulator